MELHKHHGPNSAQIEAKPLQSVDSGWTLGDELSTRRPSAASVTALGDGQDDEIVPVAASWPTAPHPNAPDGVVFEMSADSASFHQAMGEAARSDQTFFDAATHGNAARVFYLLDARQAQVDDRDDAGCTALHWAALNNQLFVAKTLTDKGGAVDSTGGATASTPLHWACVGGHLAMVMLLLDASANPLQALCQTDNQGYNAMHLAVQNGHTLLVLYLLGRGMDVDTTDAHGRTPLMWTCYVGNTADILPLLVQWGCHVNAVDDTGFTALHWAVASRHLAFAARLIREGADAGAMDHVGKTPADWADEKGVRLEWNDECVPRIREQAVRGGDLNRLLFGGVGSSSDAGFGDDAPGWNRLGLSQRQTDRVLRIMPFVALPGLLGLFAILPLVAAIPVAALAGYVGISRVAIPLLTPKTVLKTWEQAMQARKAHQARIAEKARAREEGVELEAGSEPADPVRFPEPMFGLLETSPLLSALVSASAMLVVLTWMVQFAATLPGGPLLNMTFAVSSIVTLVCFYRASHSDPGTIPRASETAGDAAAVRESVRQTVVRLANRGKLHVRNYCFSCEIERPLRSKHDRMTDRCIYRFDHYCPWANCAIGAGNHRSFVAFLYGGLVMCNTFVAIAMRHLAMQVEVLPAATVDATCPAFSPLRYVCSLYLADSWTVALVVYVLFQSNWMTLLTVFQTIQIARNRTTNENLNFARYTYLYRPEDAAAGGYSTRGVVRNCLSFWGSRSLPEAVAAADAPFKQVSPDPELDDLCAGPAALSYAAQPSASETTLAGDDDTFVPGDMASTMKKANGLASWAWARVRSLRPSRLFGSRRGSGYSVL